jgi:hypothetical protein
LNSGRLPWIWDSTHASSSRWPGQLREAVDNQAEELIVKLIRGRTKLRFFPSGQWSIAGIRFISKRIPERLLELGLIERSVMSRKGVWFHAPTPLALSIFSAVLIDLPTSIEGADQQWQKARAP